MPTTSGELARACMAGLRDAGAKFAVLHDYEELESDRISDVDIVVGQDPRTVIRATESMWRERGLLPIILWPYDIGGTATLFLATPDARDGVQLDMLHDPCGVGRYGVRSEILLQFVEERPISPVVDSAARLLYLWQKRTTKSQADRLDLLRREATGIDIDRLEKMSRALTGSVYPARGLMGQDVRTIPKSRAVMPKLSRLASRLSRPIGAWVHVPIDDVASELVRRLSRHLVIVESAKLPSKSRQVGWYLLHVAPVRYRPGVFISVGQPNGFILSPDVEIKASRPDEAAGELTEALTKRAMACVS